MQIINIHAAKTNLSRLIERALAGENIVISRNGEPLVNLVPHKLVEAKKPRRGGQWTNRITYAPDYDQADSTIQGLFDESDIVPKGQP
jgi:prevent-host-death family protein